MYLNEVQLLMLVAVFAAGIYFSYKRGEEAGYGMGYEDACVDVAHGRTIVKLVEEDK